MKTLLLSFLMLTSASLYASADCANNPYRLTRESLVVAYDVEEGTFNTKSAHAVMDEYFFNELVDKSCEKISVSKNGNVSCTNSEGTSMVVGLIKDKKGFYSGWSFYSVNWARAVVIKTKKTERGCIYGMGIL